MSIFQRSWMYITRKKKKSCLMITLLVLLISILHISLYMQKEETTIPYKYSFTYTNQATVPLEKAKQIAQLDDSMLSNYVFETYQSDQNQQMLALSATNNTSSTKDFLLNNQKLVKGRHIKEDDINKALIHEQYAKDNHLSIGDTLLDTYEIVGIYSGVKQNHAYVDLHDTKDLTEATYYTNDQNMYTKAQKIVDSSDIKQNDMLQQIQNSTSQMQSMMHVFLWITIGLSTVILTCILFFWIQERKHEIAILLSIGIEKTSILLQMIVEMLALWIVSCGIEIALFSFIHREITCSFYALLLSLLCILISITLACMKVIIQKPKQLFTTFN